MGRKEKRIIEKMQKQIMKSKKIPDDKKQEVMDAVGKLDVGVLLSNPNALADVIADPGHLANYVTEEQPAGEQ